MCVCIYLHNYVLERASIHVSAVPTEAEEDPLELVFQAAGPV